MISHVWAGSPVRGSRRVLRTVEWPPSQPHKYRARTVSSVPSPPRSTAVTASSSCWNDSSRVLHSTATPAAAACPRSTLIRLTAAGCRRRDVALRILGDLEEELGKRLGPQAVAGLRETLARAWPS